MNDTTHKLKGLAHDLDGVIADVKHDRFDAVCLGTVKKVSRELHELSAGVTYRHPAHALLYKLATLPPNEFCIVSSGSMSEVLIAQCRACGEFYIDGDGLGWAIVRKNHKG